MMSSAWCKFALMISLVVVIVVGQPLAVERKVTVVFRLGKGISQIGLLLLKRSVKLLNFKSENKFGFGSVFIILFKVELFYFFLFIFYLYCY